MPKSTSTKAPAHDDARGDHVLGLEALRIRLVVGAPAHAEEAPEDRLEGVDDDHDAPAGSSKKV